MNLITVPELAAECLSGHLARHMGRRFGSTDARMTELIPLVARLSLECIGNSDALYLMASNTVQRRLAAILAADIVGYNR